MGNKGLKKLMKLRLDNLEQLSVVSTKMTADSMKTIKKKVGTLRMFQSLQRVGFIADTFLKEVVALVK